MKNKKRIYRVISIISLLVMSAAILSLLVTFSLYRKSNLEYQELAKAARVAVAELPELSAEDKPELNTTPADTGENAETPSTEEAKPVPIPIDFSYLRSLNEDIIGWIEVEGTTIDYPILFEESKTMFYLSHNHVGTYTPYGSIVMLSDNKPDFRDFNTLVYGHNIDGSMFGVLHDFEDPDFFKENKTILVYTPDRVLQYQIFAAYRTDNLNQILNFDYETSEGRQAYIDRIFTHDVRANFDLDVPVGPDDRIITLSTCIANYAYRYLVQGVLISERQGITSAVEAEEKP